ncbi:MAG: hypothetical protein WC333_00205 [Dehalococcoidia bacterium]|jgi:hypothetical protein
MSRHTIYWDKRFSVVSGRDHMLGLFVQLFDKEMENETPEGEGLMFDWSQAFGVERNLTGISGKDMEELNPMVIINQYILDKKNEEKEEE